jgi:hypothetical protein
MVTRVRTLLVEILVLLPHQLTLAKRWRTVPYGTVLKWVLGFKWLLAFTGTVPYRTVWYRTDVPYGIRYTVPLTLNR